MRIRLDVFLANLTLWLVCYSITVVLFSSEARSQAFRYYPVGMTDICPTITYEYYADTDGTFVGMYGPDPCNDGYSYAWTIEGGSIIGPNTNSSIQVIWNLFALERKIILTTGYIRKWEVGGLPCTDAGALLVPHVEILEVNARVSNVPISLLTDISIDGTSNSSVCATSGQTITLSTSSIPIEAETVWSYNVNGSGFQSLGVTASNSILFQITSG